jgi:hypothetical protein
MQRTTVALDEAASRLSRYLFPADLHQHLLRTVHRRGLWLIGIPNAGLWALDVHAAALCALCRRAAGLRLSLTLRWRWIPAGPRWCGPWRFTAASNSLSARPIEPFLYGRSMGLSAVAVVVAAVFWTWLWGAVGLLLSTRSPCALWCFPAMSTA